MRPRRESKVMAAAERAGGEAGGSRKLQVAPSQLQVSLDVLEPASTPPNSSIERPIGS
ncbi:MAG: hypothetical protein NT062_29940 [Proteobacteria bacterium]|nr:hypothetical protein [Pseudomonadota bacterium]